MNNKTSLEEYSLFSANPSYIYRKIADVDALISIGENIANFNGYIELNESAVVLWKLMSTPKSFEELSLELQNHYQLTKEEADEDLTEFLTMALESDFIKGVSD